MVAKGEAPFMIGYLQEFKVPKPGGEYNPDLQVRVVRVEPGKEIPFVHTGEMNGMGSTKTGERAGEH